MKKGFIIIVLAGLFIVSAFAQHPLQDKNWETVFQDSFSSFNTGRWKKVNNHIHGDEPQVYINANVYLENGKVVLQTKKQNYTCPISAGGCPNCQYTGTHQYTSGQFESQIPYKYGYYEIYAKLPASDGYWPAFWFWHEYDPVNAITGCWYNEIDVFEALSCKPNVVTGGVHYDFNCPLGDIEAGGDTQPANNYSNIYHWYGVEWNSDKIIWYIDRNIVRQLPNDMGGIGIQNPMYIIINVALYPWSGNLVSPSTIFPNYMYVDQANAYRLKCDKNTVINEIYNFNKFYYAVKKSITLSGATTLPANNNISLRATDFIELKDGFEVPLGAELFLDINPCENTGATPQAQLD